MKKYIGVKEVMAKPMTKKEYCDYRNWDVPENEDPEELVYLVEYSSDNNTNKNHPNHDGYISMSPVYEFEKAYREVNGITYGLAIEALKKGYCITRKGWAGKNLFVYKQTPADIEVGNIPNLQSMPKMAKNIITGARESGIHYKEQMILVKDNLFGPRILDSWVASSSDTFAEDWVII